MTGWDYNSKAKVVKTIHFNIGSWCNLVRKSKIIFHFTLPSNNVYSPFPVINQWQVSKATVEPKLGLSLPF